MKKLTMIVLCTIIAFSPLLTLGNFAFAEDTSNGGGGGGAWNPVSNDKELVAAFKAFCQRKNFKITHSPSVVDQIVCWDYEQLKAYGQMANIDIEDLNAHIWYGYNNNNLLKFFLSKTSLARFNQIYSQIVAENILIPDVDTLVYSGKFIKDSDNNMAYCYVTENASGGNCAIRYKGTTYLYDISQITSHVNLGGTYTYTFNINNTPYNITLNRINSHGLDIIYNWGSQSTRIFVNGTDNYNQHYETADGGFAFVENPQANTVGLGSFIKYTRTKGDTTKYYTCNTGTTISNIQYTPANITYNNGTLDDDIPADKSMEVQTDSDTINNYITNNDSHDTYYYGDDDEPDDEPKQKPVPPDSITPNPNNPSLPTGVPDIDFQMPNLNIDWNLDLDINNLPFPFSIPHDIIRFLTILDSEPEAPRYQMQFNVFDTPVNIDIDLSVFDNQMAVIRIIILVGYVIFLIISTRALFHIY